ncbi:MAG: hypothetical protein LBV78_17095, partial [Kitasatospora sp.]|nr:hypothetical protein [Kitasatospora sp.]
TGLLQDAGYQLPAGVARVAVEQRQPLTEFDTFFTTFTDPTAISLAGAGQNALVTIAPDWTGLHGGTSYRLYAVPASGPRQLLATGPSARLQPDAILAAAGMTPSTQTAQTANLVYVASTGSHVWAQASIPVTFSPVSGAPTPLAPVLDPVVRGTTITVHYDLTGQTKFTHPRLEVSPPGRVNPVQNFYHPIYSVPLTATSGTVQVPVSALQGGGVYGIGIRARPGSSQYSDFAVTRVQGAPSDARPAAPLLSAPGAPPGHLLTIPYGGQFTVNWNVRDVPNAASAVLEISSGGPNDFNSYSTFNNPNGTIRDHNGHDTGSIYFARLPGTAGRTTLSGLTAGLDPTLYHTIRVIPMLSSGAPAGEASEVSAITMNGITPADGGSVDDNATGGYGINQSGTDGFLTSNHTSASGQPESSVETFNQATGAITGTVASSTSGDVYSAPDGAGLFTGDTGLYTDTTSSSTTYNLLHPVATGTAAGQWTPPSALLPPPGPFATLVPAANQQTASDAFLSAQQGNSQAQVFTSNVQANTFGPSYSIQSAVQGFVLPVFEGAAEDTSTGTAVVATADFTQPSAAPTLVTVNLANGQVATIPGVGNSGPSGVAVNSSTHTAAAPEISGVGLYNLTTGAGTFITPGGFTYQHPAADQTRDEYVIEEVGPPGSSGVNQTLNNNALSAEIVVNDQGQVLQRIEKFNLFNVFTLVAADDTQLNPARDTGYTFGLGGQQLEPFRY